MPKWVNANNNTRNPKWEYEKNKEIVGLLVGKNLDVTPKKFCFYDIEVAGDKTYSILGTVLIDKVLRTLPIGTLVKIKYLGEAKSASGNVYRNFEVMYDEETLAKIDPTQIFK